MSRSKQKPKAKTVAPPLRDLVVLAADKDTKEAIDGLLSRPLRRDVQPVQRPPLQARSARKFST